MQLIKGNHDILNNSWYQDAEIEIYDPHLTIINFTFIHDIEDSLPGTGNYFFSGHIHPGISIRGGGKQALHFPCFYFTENYCVMRHSAVLPERIALIHKRMKMCLPL